MRAEQRAPALNQLPGKNDMHNDTPITRQHLLAMCERAGEKTNRTAEQVAKDAVLAIEQMLENEKQDNNNALPKTNTS